MTRPTPPPDGPLSEAEFEKHAKALYVAASSLGLWRKEGFPKLRALLLDAAERGAEQEREELQDEINAEINRPDPPGNAPGGAKLIAYTKGERMGMRLATTIIRARGKGKEWA